MIERIGILPDTHHPYVDKRAWRVFLQAMRRFKPHRLICLGDFGDFYTVSAHRKSPDGLQRLQTEINACSKALDELDALGAKHRYFVMGNHEDRLARYIADRAPELHGLKIGGASLDVEGLFDLKRRGWQVTPYGGVCRVGKVYYAHDPSGAGQNAHYQAGIKMGHSVVHGHTHRAATAYMGNITGERRIAMMAGWLGDVRKASYVHKVPQTHSWMHAFAIGFMEADGVTHLQLVPIMRGRACVNGELIAA